MHLPRWASIFADKMHKTRGSGCSRPGAASNSRRVCAWKWIRLSGACASVCTQRLSQKTHQLLLPHTREKTAVVVVVAASVSEGVVYMYFNYALTSFRLIKTTAEPERTAKFANKQTVAWLQREGRILGNSRARGSFRGARVATLAARAVRHHSMVYCVFCVCAALN